MIIFDRRPLTEIKTNKNIALLLCKVREHYCDVPVYVMANGVQEDPARFKDSLRVYYLYNYINEALKGESTNTQIAVEILQDYNALGS